MHEKIKDSTEWSDIEFRIMNKIRGLKHEREIKKLMNNVRHGIIELSKAEVELRRGRSKKAIELLDKINNDIEMVEEYILIAALIG